MLTNYPQRRVPPFAGALLLSSLAISLIFLLHPHLGIRDVDAYAYVMGARSLHQGNGYQSLTGELFNHWPPGYSLVLSVYSDIVRAAMFLNYLSFGVTVGLTYYLFRQSGWSWQAAIGLTTALGSGFFRLLANSAKPDILTYAVFLGAICVICARPKPKPRTLPSLIWAALIPVKLIAVVFLPPAMMADMLVYREGWKKILRYYMPGIIASFAAVAGILFFNHHTLGIWIPSSHAHTSLGMLRSAVHDFLLSIPRVFLFGWHGSIGAAFPRIAFPAVLLVAAACLLSLRPAAECRWFTVYGVFCLVSSALLLSIRWYEPSVRLVGYGLLVLFLGLRPKKWANSIWLLYGCMSIAVAVVNATTVNSLGSNDPRYAALARQVRSEWSGAQTVATNSFHILDLHANIPSVPVSDYGGAAPYGSFLWVTLPSFDPGASPVTTIDHPGKDWCEQREFKGAILFSRCNSPAQGRP